MRGSFTWTLVATIPLVSGGAISHNIHALNSPTIQTAPTAAEHTEAVEASKITTCVRSLLFLARSNMHH